MSAHYLTIFIVITWFIFLHNFVAPARYSYAKKRRRQNLLVSQTGKIISSFLQSIIQHSGTITAYGFMAEAAVVSAGKNREAMVYSVVVLGSGVPGNIKATGRNRMLPLARFNPTDRTFCPAMANTITGCDHIKFIRPALLSGTINAVIAVPV